MRGAKLALGIWILAFVILGIILCSRDVRADTYSVILKMEKDKLSDYVDWIHRTMKPSYARKAKLLIPATLRHCRKYGVEPLDMGYIFFKESSWRKFKGDLGELGPGHVMPSPSRRKMFDLETLDGQIEASVYIWMQTRKCGDSLERRFAMYASGSCHPRTAATKDLAATRARQLRKVYERFKR